MPRRKQFDRLGRKIGYLHGEPTDIISVRVPISMHRQIREEARRAKQPKSRRIVDLLRKALEPEAWPKDIFE